MVNSNYGRFAIGAEIPINNIKPGIIHEERWERATDVLRTGGKLDA